MHIGISGVLAIISNTDFLDHLHNSQGLWNFAPDSNLYHSEAVYQLEFLKNHEWIEWLYSFPSHKNVKLISLSYWISGHSNPFSFSIFNAVIWTSSVFLIFRSSQILFPNSLFAPLISSLFFIQPSILIGSTQLLRDPLFILGICLFIYAWSLLGNRLSRWQWFYSILAGFILTVSMRDYLFFVFILSFLPYLVWYISKDKLLISPLILLTVILGLYAMLFYDSGRTSVNMNSTVANEFERDARSRVDQHFKSILLLKTNYVDELLSDLEVSEIKLTKEATSETKLAIQKNIELKAQERILFETVKIDAEERQVLNQSNILEIISRHIGNIRHDFNTVNSIAGSEVDTHYKIYGFIDAFMYFPRAVQIGFLAPFPNEWMRIGKQTGRIGTLLAGAEMFIWYFVLALFFYTLVVRFSIFRPLIPVFIFSIVLIILLAYVVPNTGAIYRMRQGYMIPFYIFGSYGLELIYFRFLNKKYESQ